MFNNFLNPHRLIGELHHEGARWILKFASRFKVSDRVFLSLQEAENWIESVWTNNGGLL